MWCLETQVCAALIKPMRGYFSERERNECCYLLVFVIVKRHNGKNMDMSSFTCFAYIFIYMMFILWKKYCHNIQCRNFIANVFSFLKESPMCKKRGKSRILTVRLCKWKPIWRKVGKLLFRLYAIQAATVRYCQRIVIIIW